VKKFRKLLVLAAAATASATVAYSVMSSGVIGPDIHELGNGRVLSPAGDMVAVGNFPTGGALTPDGRFYWAVSTGRGQNDIRIVDVDRATVVQTIVVPGASGGIVMDPTRPVAYLSGVANSPHADESHPDLPGAQGDVVEAFGYDARSGLAHFDHLVAVPPPPGSPIPQGIADVPGLEGPPQSFPPTNQTRLSWPDRLAVSPDGRTLLVPLNLADHAAIISTETNTVKYVAVGHYPYGAAILADGKTGLVSNETDGTVSVIDLAAGTKTADVRVGPQLSHPEAIAVDPRTGRAYVALANTDHVAVIDTATRTLVGDVSLARPQGLGVAPVALALDAQHDRLYVAEEGGDDLAVLDVHQPAPALVGRIPTAEFPTDAAVHGKTLVWLSAKGFGAGPDPNGPNPLDPRDSDNQINSFFYLPSSILGSVGVLSVPKQSQLAKYTATANRQVVPVDTAVAPTNTPLRPGGPIKHVFFVVRENRTYDQILGDVAKGDGDPSLELFGPSVTPNIHALVDRFPLLDHVYANSEASIDGHFWTSAASVSDYVQKNWMQNYAGRGRPYDFGVYSVTWPGNGFLFDQAQRQGISYFNYGEAIAGDVPLPDKDRDAAATAEVVAKFAHSDLGAGGPTGVGATPAGECYPNDADIETDAITMNPTWDSTPPAGSAPNIESRAECFKSHFDTQVATGTVPAFNYVVLPNDHTVGTTPGRRTPQAMIADNDYGLGEIVDTISHSSIWSSSAIFVVEDDSQDGADHVDAHRIPALAISPFAKRGAVVHARYDFLSFIRTLELVTGMKPLNLFDALGVPLYDAFDSAAGNTEPYTAIKPNVSLTQRNTAATPGAARSSRLPLNEPDRVPQRELDAILWKYVHGQASKPPPPGPNASGEDEEGEGEGLAP
jgi:DNA-binding beta-propeller fold protein YncE